MLKIGDLAKLSGATTKTIRYYELLGLLPEPQRTDSGYRLYDEKDVERLVFIRKAKGLGFSLTEIKETLALYDSKQDPCIHVLDCWNGRFRRLTSW
jgi:DNA-binding transcriptional MerR regulator